MSLTFFYDNLSQPSRAVEIFLKVNSISYIPKYISLMEGMQKTVEFSSINPFQKVPAIEHNGKYLAESVAILRYLCREYDVADHWYPANSYKQAKVDEYLEWHHMGTRAATYYYVWLQALYPFMGVNSKPKAIDRAKKKLSIVCNQINSIWLRETPFIGGQEISIADLLASTELQQLALTDFNLRDGYPALAQWLERVRLLTKPYYDDLQNEVLLFKNKIDYVLSQSKL